MWAEPVVEVSKRPQPVPDGSEWGVGVPQPLASASYADLSAAAALLQPPQQAQQAAALGQQPAQQQQQQQAASALQSAVGMADNSAAAAAAAWSSSLSSGGGGAAAAAAAAWSALGLAQPPASSPAIAGLLGSSSSDMEVVPAPPPPQPPPHDPLSPQAWRAASGGSNSSSSSSNSRNSSNSNGLANSGGGGDGSRSSARHSSSGGSSAAQRTASASAAAPNKWFKLMLQPNERQRKSYKNENRYILPNPLTVCLARPAEQSGLPAVSEGSVSCRLVCENGDELGDGKRDCLSGGQKKPLDPDRKCMFCLKILETSEGNKFRLLFNVQFIAGNQAYEENILSHPFKVTSNKKKSGIERPIIQALNPSVGLCTEETEVWIKGEFFADRASMVVKFGEHEARLTETEDNLICAYAPPRRDLNQDTQVPVTVTNLYSVQPNLTSEGALAYTYVFVSEGDSFSRHFGSPDTAGPSSEYQEANPGLKRQRLQ